MRKKFIISVIAFLFLLPICSYAGQVATIPYAEQSGTTLYFSATNGVSLVATKDLRDFGQELDGKYSIQFPSTITLCPSTSDPGGTGDTASSGCTVSYYYITTHDQKTSAQLNALTTSGVTLICTMALNSSSTPWTVQRFTPEFGRYLHILAKSGTTLTRIPGVILCIQ